jgi:hypothetical protein
MALSQRSTTVALLRGILGPLHGQEARFARLARRSVSWVKKVSAGHEPLTDAAALQLESATGISAAWLLRGDTAAPPVSSTGARYDFAAFERRRAARGSDARAPFRVPDDLPQTIAGIGAAADRKGRATLFAYRLNQFIEESREEFGFSDTAANAVKSTSPKAKLPPKPSANTQAAPPAETDPGVPGLETHLL